MFDAPIKHGNWETSVKLEAQKMGKFTLKSWMSIKSFIWETHQTKRMVSHLLFLIRWLFAHAPRFKVPEMSQQAAFMRAMTRYVSFLRWRRHFGVHQGKFLGEVDGFSWIFIFLCLDKTHVFGTWHAYFETKPCVGIGKFWATWHLGNCHGFSTWNQNCHSCFPKINWPAMQACIMTQGFS